jgi:cell division protein FtsN
MHPPPPPPPVVSNEPLTPAEPARPAPKTTAVPPEDAQPPAKSAPPAPAGEKATAGKAPALKETVPPVLAKAQEAPPAKGFVVQVGVFGTAENARDLQAKLAEKGIPSSTETRVVVGPFKDRTEADAVNAKLKEMGLQGMVVAPR